MLFVEISSPVLEQKHADTPPPFHDTLIPVPRISGSTIENGGTVRSAACRMEEGN